MSKAISSLASYFGLSGQMTTADHARIEQQRQKAAKAAECVFPRMAIAQ